MRSLRTCLADEKLPLPNDHVWIKGDQATSPEEMRMYFSTELSPRYIKQPRSRGGKAERNDDLPSGGQESNSRVLMLMLMLHNLCL